MDKKPEIDTTVGVGNDPTKQPSAPTTTGTDKKLVAYEQSVKAYQFQVTRYNTWMNYYALFVGALFVAFYMIICYSQSCSCTCCFCCMCCPCDDQLPSTKFLLIFITILGIVASTCWMASLIGNCAWMNNYIKAVKKNEEAFFGEKTGGDDSLVVYRRLIIKDDSSASDSENGSIPTEHEESRDSRDKWWKTCIDWVKNWKSFPTLIKKMLRVCFDFITGNGRPKFISTQKMTQWFVGAVLAAWIYIFVCLCAENSIITQLIQMIQEHISQGCRTTISVGIAFGIWLIFKIFPLFLWADNLKGMK